MGIENKRAVLIEFSSGHGECLYSQISFLHENGYAVHLVCDEVLNDKIKFFDRDILYYFIKMDKGKFSYPMILFQIRKYILKNNIQLVIFNTASGVDVRNLLLLFLFRRNIRFIGVLHDTRKLTRSFSQKIISRKIKKYFVLGDYLLNHISPKRNIQVKSFYPIFFPPYPDTLFEVSSNVKKRSKAKKSIFRNTKIVKDSGEFWISIPGQLEFSRRDYFMLLDQLSGPTLKDVLKLNIKFVLLGRESFYKEEGDHIKSMIKNLRLEKLFISFEGTMLDDIFHQYLKESDMILPLIHPGHSAYKTYYQYKISGSFNLAFAYKIPLLFEESFKKYAEFSKSAFFYEKKDLIQRICKLAFDRNLVQQKRKEMSRNKKFSFDFQCKRYMELIQ